MERKNEKINCNFNISRYIPLVYNYDISYLYFDSDSYNLDLAGVLLHNGPSGKLVLYSNTFLMLENWHHVSLLPSFFMKCLFSFFGQFFSWNIWVVNINMRRCTFPLSMPVCIGPKTNETYPLYDKFDCMTGHLHWFSIFIEKQWIKHIC